METDGAKYRVGIALSGGGVRCAAHVGVLRAFEENGLKPDAIAASSAGTISAVLYASGMEYDRMVDVFSRIRFYNIAALNLRGPGMLKLTRLRRRLMEALGPEFQRIEDLRIPTYIGLTALDHLRFDSLCQGPLGDALQASCSIPVTFKPVTINGVRYIDGGTLHCLPTLALRDKCDFLIAINCNMASDSRRFKNGMLDVILQTYTLVIETQQNNDAANCDYLLELPETKEFQMFDMGKIAQIAEIGYQAGLRAVERLRTLHPTLFTPSKT